MNRREFESGWREAAAPVLAELEQWRNEHPEATLTEIEGALDRGLAALRARIAQDMALASEAAEWRDPAERPLCPECGVPLERRGRHERSVTTSGDCEIRLERTYGECPRCSRGFFPSG